MGVSPRPPFSVSSIVTLGDPDQTAGFSATATAPLSRFPSRIPIRIGTYRTIEAINQLFGLVLIVTLPRRLSIYGILGGPI